MQEGYPDLVLMAGTPEEVAAGIAFARQQEVPFSVRSAGHGIHGLSTNDGGIILDVSRMNDITILDESRRLVRVGPGATWGNIAEKLAPYGWAMSSGDYGDVGVGGLATAGGIGWMVRQHGLTIDHIVAAEIVLADGRLLRTDAVQHPELFWGIRGAGANLGIVTAIEFEAYDTGNVIFAHMTLDASDTADLLMQWGTYMEDAPRELTSFLNITPPRRGQSQPVAQILSVFASDDIPAAQFALEPMLGWAPVIDQQAQLLPYRALVAPHNTPHTGQARLSSRTGLLERMTPDVAREMEILLQSRSLFMLQLRSLGGAVNDISPQETAYAHRTQQFFVSALAGDFQEQRLVRNWESLAPMLNGLYINFETDTSIERVKEAYPSPVFERLQQLKAEYDPGNIFNRNLNIPPARIPEPALQR
jgi:FAD/FMN-containing dehydrogenase